MFLNDFYNYSIRNFPKSLELSIFDISLNYNKNNTVAGNGIISTTCREADIVIIG